MTLLITTRRIWRTVRREMLKILFIITWALLEKSKIWANHQPCNGTDTGHENPRSVKESKKKTYSEFINLSEECSAWQGWAGRVSSSSAPVSAARNSLWRWGGAACDVLKRNGLVTRVICCHGGGEGVTGREWRGLWMIRLCNTCSLLEKWYSAVLFYNSKRLYRAGT